MITGLDHVQVAAPPGCEAAARAFYGGLLGLPELPKPPELAARGGAWFACGAQALHIGVEPDFAPARKAHPALATDDLQALERRLREAGAPTRRDGPRFYTEDPWGNRVEIVPSRPS
jgi:catechol 2,3-dioxygenase-like lactoylglutathione lyase family enzyme